MKLVQFNPQFEPIPNKEISRIKSEEQLKKISEKFLNQRKAMQGMSLETLEKLYPPMKHVSFVRNSENEKYSVSRLNNI